MTSPLVLAIGFALDLLIGDPSRLPHPVVAIGWAISLLEKGLRRFLPKTPNGELTGGAILVIVVSALSVAATLLILSLAAYAHPWLRTALEAAICCQVLAAKGLHDAGMRVYEALVTGDLTAARKAVAMVVGRDTADLDEAGVVRATVETVAENASDGVVAPMLYFAVGGAPLAMLYKAINTMDSMLGYKNEKYLYFGRAAARLDDIANFVPARLTGLLMIAAALLCGFDWRNAARIYRRDHNAHGSPNAGHPEAACAGALGVRLGGDSFYGGKLSAKPTLGDPSRKLAADDIRRANRLLYGCAALCFLLCFCGLLAAEYIFGENVLWS